MVQELLKLSELIENNYNPSRPARLLHSSDARVTVCVGGLGSGKSYSVVKEIEQSAIQWKDMPIAVYRKTMPALRDSTLEEFKKHSDPLLGHYKYREDKWIYINGTTVNFRGLDEATKAKSTNYALIVMEEAEEFTLEEFRRLNERVREVGPWPCRIILVLNPVDEDHWIYQEFVKNAAEWEQNGGLRVIRFSSYDNLDNLPPGYISQISVGLGADEIDRYIHGHWGTIVRGKAVYKDMLNPAIHLRKVELFPGHSLLRGWDFGFNHPACSFRVIDNYGRMNCVYADMGDKIHLEDYAPQIVEKTRRLFPEVGTIFDFGDPRGHDKGQGKKETAFDVLKEFGIHAIGERGSRDYVESGIKQVKKEFSTLIGGVPQLTLDPGNSLLRAAYFGRYVRDEKGYPKKDGYYDHICDADRYISHHHKHQSGVQEAIEKSKQLRIERTSSRNHYTGYGAGRK